MLESRTDMGTGNLDEEHLVEEQLELLNGLTVTRERESVLGSEVL